MEVETRMSLLAYEAHSHRYCSLVQSQRQERQRQRIPPSMVTASSTINVGTSLNPQCGQLRIHRCHSFAYLRQGGSNCRSSASVATS